MPDHSIIQLQVIGVVGLDSLACCEMLLRFGFQESLLHLFYVNKLDVKTLIPYPCYFFKGIFAPITAGSKFMFIFRASFALQV